jgi:hypothetical protein
MAKPGQSSNSHRRFSDGYPRLALWAVPLQLVCGRDQRDVTGADWVGR